MKTHTIVLNSRPGAKRAWPKEGTLARTLELAPNDATGHCCIGCEGLARGIPLEDMEGVYYPCSMSDEYAEWQNLWETPVPTSLVEEVLDVAQADEYVRELIYKDVFNAQNIAAHLNDAIALFNPESAIAGIRILFKWLGEQHDERWIVRWLR